MNAPLCAHERDVLDLVAIGQWPQRADARLRAHVITCATCAEVAEVAVAVREWGDADPVAHLPEASVVWHRAQVKAREAASRAASRPVWVAQGAALVALIVALVVIGPGVGWYASLWSGVTAAAPAADVSVETFTSGWGRAIVLAAGALVLLASVAIGAVRFSERSEASNHQ